MLTAMKGDKAMEGNWKLVKPARQGRPKTRYYLAYGSNLNMYQMMARCPGALRRGWGRIEDYELLYKGKRRKTRRKSRPRSWPLSLLLWQMAM